MIIAFDKSIFDSTDFKGVNFLLQLCTYKNRYEVFADLTPTVKIRLFSKVCLMMTNSY